MSGDARRRRLRVGALSRLLLGVTPLSRGLVVHAVSVGDVDLVDRRHRRCRRHRYRPQRDACASARSDAAVAEHERGPYNFEMQDGSYARCASFAESARSGHRSR